MIPLHLIRLIPAAPDVEDHRALAFVGAVDRVKRRDRLPSPASADVAIKISDWMSTALRIRNGVLPH